MSEDYLWDRSGEPDDETVRLEKLLGKLRYSGEVPAPRRAYGMWWLAAAALVVAGVSIPLALHRGPVTPWQVSVAGRAARTMRAGQLIETGAATHAKVEAQATGEISIDPRSRLRLISSGQNQQRFDLRRGTIHAFIWAPPGRFVVDTPSSRTVDLGCKYTLHVGDDGTGLLTVELGWVAFEWQKRESFIPAGAACVTRPRLGPGTPYFTDASPVLKDALTRFDTGKDPDAVGTAISAARDRDALTLWHLLIRTQNSQRGEVFDQFAKLVHLPAQVTKSGILRGDSAAIDGAWNALQLGDTTWWREWKQPF